ncbi:MAG TPA: DUF4198 domain-containing protein [Thermoanaerobaculia bacterium]|jgi:hypothetical protein
MKRFLLTALLAPAAFAHDFWIEPSTFRPAAATTFTASLRVGENFEGEAVPRRPSRIVTFAVRDAAGEQPVNGFANQDPAGYVRVDRAGTAVIGYRGTPYPHEVSRTTFEKFLAEEGIENVRVTGARQRERYQRFAKSIVQIGDPRTSTPSFGFPFELMLDGDVVRVMYERKPLPNTHIAAISRDGNRVTARSDANGNATLKLGKGVWLIKSVHIVAAPKGADYDWDSLWASITLQR